MDGTYTYRASERIGERKIEIEIERKRKRKREQHDGEEARLKTTQAAERRERPVRRIISPLPSAKG